MHPKAGLLVGSISLIGGVGTTLAWSPTFVEAFDISNALEIGVAANTAGILIGNCRNLFLKREEAYPGAKLGIALFSDISLGMFLTMALMGLQVWELQGLVAFIASVMFCQILI